MIVSDYNLRMGQSKEELLRLKKLQGDLEVKFREEGNDNPELAAKITIAAFASHPKKSVFTNIVALASNLLARCVPPRAIYEIIDDLRESDVPGFTDDYRNVLIEIMMGRAGIRVFPDPSPVVIGGENLAATVQAEQGAGEGKGGMTPSA
jgi:hypothetical protein